MPIAIMVGDQDLFFPLGLVTGTKKEFESNGFMMVLTVIPNHDHNYYLISDEVNGMAWDFLKKSQLKQPEALEPH